MPAFNPGFTDTVALLIVAFIMVQYCHAQGFMNLGFESANVSGYSPGSLMSPSDALPGWACSLAPVYDGVSLGGAMISLQDSNTTAGSVGFSVLPIQGNYSVLLQGSIPAAASTASIGQTGTIPLSAQSLTFWGTVAGNVQGQTLQISFNNQTLSFAAISNALTYTVYGADISPFAGQTGQLLFTVPVQGSALLDNFQFSSIPVPEPTEFALVALGASFLGFRRWRNICAGKRWRDKTPPV